MEKFVTGMSLDFNSFKAGRTAAATAASELGECDPGLVLAYATSGHEQEEVLRGIRSIFPDAALSGATVEGLITRQGACEDTHAVGLMALSSADLEFHTLLGRNFSDDSEGCAADILGQLPESAFEEGGLLLLFPDGMSGDCAQFLNVLNEGLPSSIVVVGGGAGAILTPDPTAVETPSQYHNSEVVTGSVAGVFIGGNIEVETAVSHGCLPIGLELEVTRSTGSIVQEIDNRPAWEVFKEYIPDPENGFRSHDMVYLSVGVKLPDMDNSEYGEYIIRSPSRVNYETGSVHFAGRLEEGSKISMVRRAPDQIQDSARACAQGLSERRVDKPLFILQFDCAGRGRLLFGDRTTEMAIEPIHDAFSDDIPLIGFHSFGEIAPLSNTTIHHNYTVALCAVYHRSE